MGLGNEKCQYGWPAWHNGWYNDLISMVIGYVYSASQGIIKIERLE